MPFEVVDIPHPVEAKAMIITDDHVAGMKAADNKFVDILIGTQLRKSHRERCDNQMVHRVASNQRYLFLDGREQTKIVILWVDDAARVRMKSDNDTFAARALCQPVDAVQQFLMPQMHPVERTYGNYRVVERRQLI